MDAHTQAKGSTYHIIGGDGKEYGPANLNHIMAWILEKRIRAESQIRRDDQAEWAAADTYPELEVVLKAGGPLSSIVSEVSVPGDTTGEDSDARRRLKSGASWFYWIAGLSLINSIIALLDWEWGFILGLGLTQIFGYVGAQLGVVGAVLALLLSLMVTGAFIAFGIYAQKGQLWAFIVGMVLYAGDTLLFLLGLDWFGLGFHVLALVFLFRGLLACQRLGARAQHVLNPSAS